MRSRPPDIRPESGTDGVRPEPTAGSDRGSATVEQVGIILLIAVLFATLVAIWLTGVKEPPGRQLGQRIANRIACGPRAPGVCRQHPSVSAYGWSVARAVRLLAPPVAAVSGPGGEALIPVDFRYCQRSSCAIPVTGSRGAELTTANRRSTFFTEVTRESPGSGSGAAGSVRITYWLYRPSIGWEAIHRSAGPAEIEAAAGTRVLLKDSPRLVPLEILPGRNHYDLPAGDEPPWRWQVFPRHPGWSS